MELEHIIQEILEDNPVAFLIITDKGDHYTSTVYGRINKSTVFEVIKDWVEQVEKEVFDKIKDKLPF